MTFWQSSSDCPQPSLPFSGSVPPEVSAFIVLHSLSGFPCLVKNKTCSSGWWSSTFSFVFAKGRTTLESLRLEKTCKVIESNRKPSSDKSTTKPCSQVPHLCLWWLHHCPEWPVPMLDNPSGEEIFPDIQPKAALVQPEAISSGLVTC